ncbi:MAG: hypothetical protein LBE99_02320, partial [Puniceicoccales bacterium]|nr:hypothetical protein [Puniceicoccales bacterium]
ALNDPELAEKYKDHIRNLGIASMVLGVVGSLMSVGAGGATSCTGVAKAVKTGGQIAGALCTIGQGTVDILKGCNMIELAEQNKELEVKRMELEKLDSEIDFLQKLIDSLTRSVQEFLDLFLNAEQTAAQEVLRMVDAQLTIVDEIPRTA